MSNFMMALNSTEDWELEIGKPAEGDEPAGESGAPGYLQGAWYWHTLTGGLGCSPSAPRQTLVFLAWGVWPPHGAEIGMECARWLQPACSEMCAARRNAACRALAAAVKPMVNPNPGLLRAQRLHQRRLRARIQSGEPLRRAAQRLRTLYCQQL